MTRQCLEYRHNEKSSLVKKGTGRNSRVSGRSSPRQNKGRKQRGKQAGLDSSRKRQNLQQDAIPYSSTLDVRTEVLLRFIRLCRSGQDSDSQNLKLRGL
jgi:hypothetical protein